MRRWLARGLLAAGAVLAGALPAGAAEKLVRMNYGVPQFPVSVAAVFSVPEAMGFWAQEGLKVEVEGAQGAGPALQQLVAGHVQLTFTGLPTAMALINKGAKLHIVASAYRTNVFYPAVLPDSPVRTIADLKGKTIGASAVASTNALWIRALMRSAGVSDADIHIIGVGDGAGALNALRTHQVDALQLFEADYDRFEALGTKLRRLNDNPMLGVLSFVQGFVAADATIEKDPQVLVGLLRGVAKGVAWAKAHPEEAIRIHWKEFPESKPPGVEEAKALHAAADVLRHQLSHYTGADGGSFGLTEPKNVEATRDALFKLGQLSQSLPAARYYTPEFVAKINDFDHAAVVALAPGH